MKNCNNRYILLIGMCVVFFDLASSQLLSLKMQQRTTWIESSQIEY